MNCPDEQAGWRRRRTLGICAGLLLVFALLGYLSLRVSSATIDEPLHAAAGYHHLFDRDFRVNPEDPPLWKYWAMLPHTRGELQPDVDLPLWDKVLEDVGYQYVTATRRLYQVPGNDGAGFINASRVMMLLVGVGLGVALAAWSWQLAGATGAVAACFLFAFDPNYLGHAPLVKNDVSLSLVMFGGAWATFSAGRQARWWNVLLVGLSCAAAVTVKFSGLLLGPMVAIMLAARALLPQAWVVMGRQLNSRAARVGAAAGICLLAVAISYLCIWACYGFRFDPTPLPGKLLNLPHQIERLKQERLYVENDMTWPTTSTTETAPMPLAASLAIVAQDHRLLPQAWIFGLFDTYRSTQMRETFLLGWHAELGCWYYFPLAMLFKTPLATLASILLSIMVLIRYRSAKTRADIPPPWTAICVAFPLIVYGFSALTTNLNLGLRHVLPLYPFIYLLVAVAAAKLRATRPARLSLLGIVLGVGLTVECFAAFPHYISFFNAVCRPQRLRLLSGSNFDWGQGLGYVLEWQQKNPGVPLYLGYQGVVDPQFYGIDYINIPGGFFLNPRWEWPPSRPGVIAISATLLQGVNCPPSCRAYYAPLRQRTPRAVLGDTIYLYDWPLQ
jgi:hypothetical protein